VNKRIHSVPARAARTGTATAARPDRHDRQGRGHTAAPATQVARLLHLQRTIGNAAVARLMAAPTSVQRAKLNGEPRSAVFLAVKVGGSRYDEVLDIVKSFDEDENFETVDDLKERVNALLPANGVILPGGKVVSITGTGSRYNAHISLDQSIAYIRQFRNEIIEGDSQSLKVGEGRTTGFAVRGQILYNYSGSTISIYHAHNAGKMG